MDSIQSTSTIERQTGVQVSNHIAYGVDAEMERSTISRWLAFWFFIPSSLAMLYFILNLASRAPSYATVVSTANAAPKQIHASLHRVDLAKGRATLVGNTMLTYQGIRGNHIALEITLLDLNPDVVYRRDIPIPAAERGFWLAEQYFRMVSAGRSVLQIVPVHR
jgi:hypothetical protein